MPVDAILVSLAVTVVFVAFAVVLAWADHHTGSQAAAQPQKRRDL
ncbi:hypothetical protein [Bradyrhizobium sp.]